MCAQGDMHKEHKYEPPDGKWGYMICVAVTVILTVLTGFANSSALIYKERFNELAMDTTSVAIVNNLGGLCVAISGFSTSFFLKYTSIRKLGFVAALFYSLGLFGTALCSSKAMLFIFQGIIKNLGHGLLINISFTMLNQYFVQRRIFAMSIVQTVPVIATLATPMLVKCFLERYGPYWNLLLISAISFHNILAIILLQPVSKHMKRVELPETKEIEIKSLVREKIYHHTNVPNTRYKVVKNANEKAKTGGDLIMKFVGKEMYKKFLLSNAFLGLSICLFADVTFFSMLSPALYYMGWNEALVSRALALFGLGNLFARMLFIFISKWLGKMGTPEIYVIGLLIACLSRLGMLWSDNRIIMQSFLVIVGVSRAFITVLHPIVIADCVSPDKFTEAMGLSMLAFGLVSFILGPTISAIRMLTDSYATAFYILTSCFGIVVIFWTIELVYKKNAHKWKPRRSLPEKP
ncbi:unnamed protein product [Leptosia nina]|uniref:Major facilitator superfamily (MFS) profile domain-containing protein n=1 Tax=Leptosia nina TaxID=320188 RepID=A0AAV1IV16_9NEOP